MTSQQRNSLNRTILELKYITNIIIINHTTSLNRTILELKYSLGGYDTLWMRALNRTILELKSLRITANTKTELLSIAPYWN